MGRKKIVVTQRGSADRTKHPPEVIDLANHPQHGNLLYRRQVDVARLLGISKAYFSLLYNGQHPKRRWPARQYVALFRRMQRTYADHQVGRIGREFAHARMKCVDAEIRQLIGGPVLLSME